MAHETILVVEDEADLVELYKYNLEKEGYRVFTAADGEQALKLVKQVSPKLILLDLLLPGIDGQEVCRLLKQERDLASIQIIMVTAKSEDADVITGLEIGADDYMVKPFSPSVLLARIRNLLRRSKRQSLAAGARRIKIHDIQIDTERYEVLVEGERIKLSATEYAMLKLFAGNPGIVFSRSQIINAIKGEDYPVTERAVDVQILGLRKKLGNQGRFIETLRGIGYSLTDVQP